MGKPSYRPTIRRKCSQDREKNRKAKEETGRKPTARQRELLGACKWAVRRGGWKKRMK